MYDPSDYGTLEGDCGIPSCDVSVDECVACAEAEAAHEMAHYEVTTCDEPG